MSRFTKRKHLYCFASLRKMIQNCSAVGNRIESGRQKPSKIMYANGHWDAVQFNVTLHHIKQVVQLLFAKMESLLKKHNCNLVTLSAPINHLANAEKQSCQTK